MDSNEKLRAQIASLEIKVEQQKSRLSESRTRQQIEEAREDGAGTEGGGWKSAVVTRMYEDRVRALEVDLEKKVQGFPEILQLSWLSTY